MSQLNSVWVFSDNPERYAELFGGAQQWGQQVYAIVQNTEQAQAVMPYGPKCIYVLEQTTRCNVLKITPKALLPC